MMHPHTELRFISDQIGHGVVATHDIPQGSITWIQDRLDRVFAPEEVTSLGDAFSSSLEKYCFRNQHGHWILCWDHARYVNHSFRSNCLTTAFSFEIAIRDIKAGEELTDDYGYLNVTQPFAALDEGTERTVVYTDDLLRYHPIWDRQLHDAWPRIPAVDQPLAPLLSRGTWRRVIRIAAGQEPMPSILECHFRDDRVPAAHGAGSNGVAAPTRG